MCARDREREGESHYGCGESVKVMVGRLTENVVERRIVCVSVKKVGT